jgi:hypothetical protein
MAWKAVETIPIRIDGRISPARAHGVQAALLPRVFPVARLVDGRVEPLATGSLVASAESLSLLTAAHVFDEAAVGDLALPMPSEGGWAFLRAARPRVFVHPERDIALVHLEDRAFVRRLLANWKPLPAACLPEPAHDRPCSLYVLAGYPASQARRIDGAVYMKPVVVFTGALDGERFAYARTAERADGVSIHTPELDGVSGALVWAVHENEPDADCLLRAAAVQVAFAHGRYLRAEPLHPARALLGRLR